MEFTLLWAALTGVAGLWLGTRLWTNDSGDPESESLFDPLLLAAGAGLVGGRVVAMLVQGLNPVVNLGDLLIVRGGVNTVAATVFAIGTFFMTTGRSLKILDLAAPAALLGLAGWHLGCLWRGACLGTASSLPWAWADAGSSITRHPVEIYTAILMALAAVTVSRLPRRIGLRSSAALGLASGVRLLTEPFRLSVTGGPVWWYLVGVAVGLAGVVAALLRSPDPD